MVDSAAPNARDSLTPTRVNRRNRRRTTPNLTAGASIGMSSEDKLAAIMNAVVNMQATTDRLATELSTANRRLAAVMLRVERIDRRASGEPLESDASEPTDGSLRRARLRREAGPA
jgi:hypothetical protein